MNVTQWIHPLISYNAWANYQLINWLKSLNEDQFKEELTSSFSSIKKTALHIWNAERFWQSFIKKEAPLSFRKDHAGNKTDFLKEWEDETMQMAEYFRSLTNEFLLEINTVNTPWLKGEMPCYAFIQHVVNHGTYHRGQLITLGRILGLTEPPNTDYSMYVIKHYT